MTKVKKNILITGCSSGIGLATANQLQAAGWQVYATVRKPSDAAPLLAGIKPIIMDTTDNDSIHAAFWDVVGQLQGLALDAVFHNAGYGQQGAVEDLTRDMIRAQFETNVFGAWELTRLILPMMRTQGHGRVLFCSSFFAYAPAKFRGAYTASKYAIEGLCDTLRLELHNTNIHVSIIQPGSIETQFRANALLKMEALAANDHSPHQAAYAKRKKDLQGLKSVYRYTLPPEAVARVVQTALAAKRPKPRYRITWPAQYLWYAKRWLPTRWLDAWLLR